MLKIVLCDDDHNTVKQYGALIWQIAEKHQVEVQLSSFYSGESFLFHYTGAQEQIDIIYLDVGMDKINGMDTARKLRERGSKAQIIFLTNYEEYVYKAFDVNALHYLIKDHTAKEKFETVFLKAVELASNKDDELFTFEFDGKTSVIPIGKITYFDIWKRVVTVHYSDTKSGKFYGRSMDQLENELSTKGFVRVHRSYLVHLSYIAMFRQQNLQLKSGEVIPVGITYAGTLKKTFSEYISQFHICSITTSNGKEINQ